jgi:hypothetical protein
MVIQAIPTTYKKTKFRSKLESQWARWLDEYNIKWSYETQGFRLTDGTWYLPDFYLHEIETFIEVKGALENIEKPYQMVQMLQEEEPNWPDEGTLFLLAGPVDVFYNIHPAYTQGIRLRKCSCGVTSILTEYGSYACRSCGDHDGAHITVHQIPIYQKPLKWLLLERD